MGWITHHRNVTEHACNIQQHSIYIRIWEHNIIKWCTNISRNSGIQQIPLNCYILQTSDLDITFQDSNVFRVTSKTGKETSFKHTNNSWSWITKSHDEMPAVKCQPFCRSKTRALIDLWYQKCGNHIASSAVGWTTWSITDTEFSAPSHNYPYYSPNTEDVQMSV